MATFTLSQLKAALHVQEQIESLEKQRDALLASDVPAASRKKLGPARRARLANVKSPLDEPVNTGTKKKGGLTAAGRAKLAAAMKARWAARKKGAPAPNAVKN